MVPISDQECCCWCQICLSLNDLFGLREDPRIDFSCKASFGHFPDLHPPLQSIHPPKLIFFKETKWSLCLLILSLLRQILGVYSSWSWFSLQRQNTEKILYWFFIASTCKTPYLPSIQRMLCMKNWICESSLKEVASKFLWPMEPPPPEPICF